MIEFSFFLLGLGIFFVSLSYSYKIISETRLKSKSVKKSSGVEQINPSTLEDKTSEDLMKRLDEFRNQRFSRNLVKNSSMHNIR